jgi:hypothetical protein
MGRHPSEHSATLTGHEMRRFATLKANEGTLQLKKLPLSVDYSFDGQNLDAIRPSKVSEPLKG